MTLKVEKEFEWQKFGSFRRGDPYTIAFCYGIEGEKYVLKGSAMAIEKHLNKRIKPVFVNLSFWHHKHSRNFWRLYGVNARNKFYISRISKSDRIKYGTSGFECFFYNKGEKVILQRYRKLPQAFPKEIKRFIETGVLWEWMGQN